MEKSKVKEEKNNLYIKKKLQRSSGSETFEWFSSPKMFKVLFVD